MLFTRSGSLGSFDGARNRCWLIPRYWYPFLNVNFTKSIITLAFAASFGFTLNHAMFAPCGFGLLGQVKAAKAPSTELMSSAAAVSVLLLPSVYASTCACVTIV